MSQDELNRAEQLARARDITEQFNVNQRSGVQTRNVGSRNRAQEMDLDYRRRVADANIALANKQLESDREARLGVIEDRNKKKINIANARIGQAAQADAGSAARASGWSDTLSGIGSLAVKGKEAGLWGGTSKKETDDFFKNLAGAKKYTPA